MNAKYPDASERVKSIDFIYHESNQKIREYNLIMDHKINEYLTIDNKTIIDHIQNWWNGYSSIKAFGHSDQFFVNIPSYKITERITSTTFKAFDIYDENH